MRCQPRGLNPVPFRILRAEQQLHRDDKGLNDERLVLSVVPYTSLELILQ